MKMNMMNPFVVAFEVALGKLIDQGFDDQQVIDWVIDSRGLRAFDMFTVLPSRTYVVCADCVKKLSMDDFNKAKMIHKKEEDPIIGGDIHTFTCPSCKRVVDVFEPVKMSQVKGDRQ